MQNKQDVKERQIIGGVFGLHVSEKHESMSLPSYLNTTHSIQYYANARSAIWAILVTLRPKTVWYPSYLCPSMLHIQEIAGIQGRFYPVDTKLQVNDVSWIENVGYGDVVLFIDYFGFQHTAELYDNVKRNGAYVLEDASQALLSENVGAYSDYYVLSPRKYIGLPDGGVLCTKQNVPSIDMQLHSPSEEWWLKAYSTVLLRYRWDNDDLQVSQDDWYQERKRAGKDIPCGPYSISTMSLSILKSANVDWQNIMRKRRENYLFLQERFKYIAIFDMLPSDVVPLGFPIRVPAHKRDSILKELYIHQIYPPVHWRLENIIPSEWVDSLVLSAEEITLPCDQRYTIDDMNYMSDILATLLE